MMAANLLLQAIHARLSGDAGLAALLAPDGLRDRLSAQPDLPAVVFGAFETRDHSTATEAGEEHFLTLEVWSEAAGRRQVHEIAARLDQLLDDAALALDGASLVSLLRIGLISRRDAKTRFFVAELTFRAVTE